MKQQIICVYEIKKRGDYLVQYIGIQILNYFTNNMDAYMTSAKEHILISLLVLMLAILIGVPGGYACVKNKKYERWIISVFQILRIVPSLAVLILLIPVMGTGLKPAVTALVLLAVPPILMNTAAGLEEVPDFMLETARGMGMTDRQELWKVKLPLAAPLILTGIKTAMIEIVASATLASKIGAGGLGDIIFTGLGLNRTDLLLVGGISVAVLSIAAGILLDLVDRLLLKHKYIRK
jgi:osmoprotectant transport system permease protein